MPWMAVFVSFYLGGMLVLGGFMCELGELEVVMRKTSVLGCIGGSLRGFLLKLY